MTGGTFRPPPPTKNYGMATVVATVFKVVAWLWLLAAIVTALNARAAANDLGTNAASQGAVSGQHLGRWRPAGVHLGPFRLRDQPAAGRSQQH